MTNLQELIKTPDSYPELYEMVKGRYKEKEQEQEQEEVVGEKLDISSQEFLRVM